MSESGEENGETVNGQSDSGAAEDDEFGFYLQFTKPLVLDLAEPEDRAIAAAWVRKLEEESNSEEEKQLRTNYLKLLLFVLQRGRLGGIFRKQPPSGPLQSFPAGFSVFDMGNLILDQDELQPSGAGDGRGVNYNIEISNDLREFVASQEIPNFGIQMYYAWSSEEPIHKWSVFDEEKFPQYVLDKIKLLKEMQSDEKTDSVTKSGSQSKKKICEIPVLEKNPKKKVKSPQEIERSQGRSFHTYMGLVGRMGNFNEKCDGDPDRYQRQQPQQGKGTCPRRISHGAGQGQGQGQGQCPGQGQKRFANQGEGEDDRGEDGFQNFMPGISDLVNSQSRPCLCPYPCHHADCPEHRGARGGPQQDPFARPSRTNTTVRQSVGTPEWGAQCGQTQTKGPAPMRANDFDPYNARSIGPPQGGACPHRRSASPLPKSNCPSRTNFEPPPQDLYGRQNFNQGAGGFNNFCTCPCPRAPQQMGMIGPSPSGIGGMGGVGGMGGMGGLGYMAGIGGMGGMGMGGMQGMGGMGMGGMPGMGGMGGMGCMMGMGGMGGMRGMGGMGGMGGPADMGGPTCMGAQSSMIGPGGMGGGRPYQEGLRPPGRQTVQPKARPVTKGQCPDSGRPAANYRTPQNAIGSRVDQSLTHQVAAPPGGRPGVPHIRSRQDIVHCYDNLNVDPAFTHTIQKNASANECAGPYTHQLSPVGEEHGMHSQECNEDESPEDITKKHERTALIAAARENKAYLAAKKTLFDSGASKSQSGQLPCPNTATLTKRPYSPGGAEGRSPAYTGSTPERVVQSDRSTSLEPLSQSPSPRPQMPCTPQQQMQQCPPNTPKTHVHGAQGPSGYAQEGPSCPAAGTKVLSSNRPGPSKATNLNKSKLNPNASKGGVFAVNNESGRLCNITGVLQGIRQITDNYRQPAEEQAPRPEPCPFSQSSTDSTFDYDFDFTNYVEPPPPRPEVYYSPQPRRRGLVTSPCPERDIASLPDQTTGMGVFHPQKLPTQAQPLPTTPPDCAYIDYNKYEDDEYSFLYSTEESSWEDQQRGETCPYEEEPAQVMLMEPPYLDNMAKERSSVMSEKIRDLNRRDTVHFEHSTDTDECVQVMRQSSVHIIAPDSDDSRPLGRCQKSNRRDNFLCSTPCKRCYNTLPITESTIFNTCAQESSTNCNTYPLEQSANYPQNASISYNNCPRESHHTASDIIITESNDQPGDDFIQIFGVGRQNVHRCSSQQRDTVLFETAMDETTRHGDCTN